MNYAKALIILFIVSCCPIAVNAQYWTDKQEIATDYNTCLEGVKDSLGNWIIQPQYENVEQDLGRYIVQAGGKYGVLTRSGKVLIPLMWDAIRSSDHWYSGGLVNCFVVMKNGKWGVCDSNNRMIVPTNYLYVHCYSDSSFIAKKSRRAYDFYNYSGTRFECPWKMKKQPSHEGDHKFLFTRHGLFGKKYGLINDSGTIIFRRKYDYIDVFHQTGVCRLDKHGKYGYASTAGAMYWPLVFRERKNESNSYAGERSLVNYGTGPAQKDGKWGLITLDGKTILPFEYDNIAPFDEASIPFLWKIKKDTLAGVYDIRKGWLLQPTCSEMFSVNSFFNHQDSSVTVLLIANQSGKWGAMTSAGQVIIPFECEDAHALSGTCFAFMKQDSLLALTLPTFHTIQWYREEISDIEPIISFWFEDSYEPSPGVIPESNQFSYYKGLHGVRAFYHPAQTRDTMFGDSASFVISQGKFYGRSLPDSIIVSCAFAVIPLLNPALDMELFDFYTEVNITDKDSTVHFMHNPMCILHKNGKNRIVQVVDQVNTDGEARYFITNKGDLLKSTGEIILDGDTTETLEEEHHHHDGSLYFTHVRHNPRFEICAYDTNGAMVHPYTRLGISDFTSKYTWQGSPGSYYDNYQLTERATGLNLLGNKVYSEETYPIWDSITIVQDNKRGVRLFNIAQHKYFTAFGFNEIIPLRSNGTLFAVKTCSKNIGVVDVNGNVVLDTVYTAFTTVRTKDYIVHGAPGFQSDFFREYYEDFVFYNDQSSVHFNATTSKITSHADYIDSVWYYTAYGIQTDSLKELLEDSLYYIRGTEVKVNLFMTQQDSASMLPWQRMCLIDSLYTPDREVLRYGNYSNFNCDYCRDRGLRYSGIRWTKHGTDSYYYMVSHRSDSLLCFNRFELTSYRSTMNKQLFSTVMLFADGPHQMTLDSLFNPASDWRNFIINTLITYVNSHQDIDGDCHNPAGIPLMLNKSFELASEGLILYPPEFKEKGKQLVLVIPWKDAETYLRKDIRSRLPKPQ